MIHNFTIMKEFLENGIVMAIKGIKTYTCTEEEANKIVDNLNSKNDESNVKYTWQRPLTEEEFAN